jgi:hypothetical protein
MSRAERRALVERKNPTLPVSQQCRLLAVSRSSTYRRPPEVSETDRVTMGLIDRQYLALLRLAPHGGVAASIVARMASSIRFMVPAGSCAG